MLFALRERFRRQIRNEQGNVIILVGIMAFLLILAVGVAVDMARAQVLQQRISAALDASGLAAMVNINNPPDGLSSTAWAQQEAQRYFRGNFPTGYLGSATINVVVQNLAADNSTLTLAASTTQTTTFMQTFGVETMNVGAVSSITRSSNGTVIELVLVLDNTGSMACDVTDTNPTPSSCTSGPNSKIVALKSAAGQLIQSLYGTNASVPNQYVGVVPFSQAVNVGSGVQLTSWMNPSDPHNNTDDFTLTHGSQGPWAGCVTAGASPYNVTDDPPSVRTFDRYWYAPPSVALNDYVGSTVDFDLLNSWRTTHAGPPVTYTYDFSPLASPYNANLKGPNLYCPSVVTPMTSDKATILNAISALTPSGDTLIDQGLVWGWRMISPKWRGAWNSTDMIANNLPLDYNSTGSEKFVVLITDGSNHLVQGGYSAYGFPSDGQLGEPTTVDPLSDTQLNNAASQVDTNVSTICNSLGGDHVTIYTIGFGTPATDSPLTPADREKGLLNQPLLQSCANVGNGHYYAAPTNADLADAFSQIANAIENIRVSK